MYKRIITNAKDEEITDQMVKWIYSAGRPLPGLIKRRTAEANLFIGYERYKVLNNIITKV
jgi:GH24 family phage-related lysozyme (muramidase)